MPPPPKLPLAAKAYDALRRMIAAGEIRSEPISEVRLAAEIDVSRTPVREAVRRLVGENILEVTPQGIRLYRPSVEDLAEVYFTRATLEGAAAKLAAATCSVVLAKQLREMVTRAERLMVTDDHDGFVRLNGQFHGLIVNTSGNKRIRELLASLDTIIVRYRRLSLVYPDHLRQSYDDHVRIVELFETGSPAKVEEYVRDHILRAGARIVRASKCMDEGGAEIGSTAATLLAIHGAEKSPSRRTKDVLTTAHSKFSHPTNQ